MYHISEDKRSQESSAMIYDALVALMGEKAYEHIKINELCQRAKLGRVTFYRHYDTIDDVLRKKLDDHLKDFASYWQEYQKEFPWELGMFKPLLRYFYVHPTIIKLIFQSRQLSIVKDSMIGFFSSLHQGTPQPTSDYIHVIRVSVLMGILEKWTCDGMNIPPDELVASVKKDIMTIAMGRLADL